MTKPSPRPCCMPTISSCKSQQISSDDTRVYTGKIWLSLAQKPEAREKIRLVGRNYKMLTVSPWRGLRPLCCILTFDPAKHAIPKTAEVHFPLAWASLADKMGQVKILPYSHRLMHRKRVTCEPHDSYFRLMTIKHAIPKIEWAIELLYNSVKTGSQLVWRPVGDKMW